MYLLQVAEPATESDPFLQQQVLTHTFVWCTATTEVGGKTNTRLIVFTQKCIVVGDGL